MPTYKAPKRHWESHQYLQISTNTQGRHGKGNALYGYQKMGAIYGQAKGRMGDCYGIVTKDLTKSVHPSVSRDYIIEQINEFYAYVAPRTDEEWYVPYRANVENLNGYTVQQMADMYAAVPIPRNVYFESGFAELMGIVNGIPF